MAKLCKQCRICLPLTDFYVNRRMKDGHLSYCKACVYKRQTKYPASVYGTPRILRQVKDTPNIENVSRLMYRRIYVRRYAPQPWYEGVEVRINQSQVTAFIKANWKVYLTQWRIWKASGYQRRSIPTIDRIDPSGHYEPSNIQLLPLWQNVARQRPRGQRLSPASSTDQAVQWSE